jgi:hypothetical protein
VQDRLLDAHLRYGVAVGGRFAPASVKVPGLREFDLKTAVGQPR